MARLTAALEEARAAAGVASNEAERRGAAADELGRRYLVFWLDEDEGTEAECQEILAAIRDAPDTAKGKRLKAFAAAHRAHTDAVAAGVAASARVADLEAQLAQAQARPPSSGRGAAAGG